MKQPPGKPLGSVLCALHHTIGGVKSKGAQRLETTVNIWLEMVSKADSALHAPENPETASPSPSMSPEEQV